MLWAFGFAPPPFWNTDNLSVDHASHGNPHFQFCHVGVNGSFVWLFEGFSCLFDNSSTIHPVLKIRACYRFIQFI